MRTVRNDGERKSPRDIIAGAGFFNFNQAAARTPWPAVQARSKRSAFITLVQAATKSFANFSLASELA